MIDDDEPQFVCLLNLKLGQVRDVEVIQSRVISAQRQLSGFFLWKLLIDDEY